MRVATTVLLLLATTLARAARAQEAGTSGDHLPSRVRLLWAFTATA